MFGNMSSSLEHVRSGRLRALAVTTATRWRLLPDIPAIGEFVPGYDASGWNGIGAPKSTPTEIVEKLNNEINAVIADPKIEAHLIDSGIKPMAMTPADFGKRIAADTAKWAKVIQFANIKPD